MVIKKICDEINSIIIKCINNFNYRMQVSNPKYDETMKWAWQWLILTTNNDGQNLIRVSFFMGQAINILSGYIYMFNIFFILAMEIFFFIVFV